MSFYDEHYEIKGVVVVDRLIMGMNVYSTGGLELRMINGLIQRRFSKEDKFQPSSVTINELLKNSFYVNKEEK